MVYIISRKGKHFNESYLTHGGIEKAERDGITKSQMMTEINHLTDRGISVDERRRIVSEFADRNNMEKGR